MTSTLRTTALAILFFFSFHLANAQQPTTALQFNDYLVTITDTLYMYGKEWGDQFNVAHESKDFTSLSPMRIRIEEYAAKKFLDVTTMKDIKGSEKLRAAMLEFLAYEKLMINERFTPMEKLNSSSTDDDIQKHLDALATASKGEATALKKVNDAQKEYAKKNGFTIEESEE